jgi:transposase-like protein
MTPNDSLALLDQLFNEMMDHDDNMMRGILEKTINMLMRMDVESMTGAGRYERTGDRENYLNGYRERSLDTAEGRLDLKIPKLRKGTYYPGILEPRRMVDRALVNIIQEAYINGVSTRKVDKLVEDLGINCDKSQVSRLTSELQSIVDGFRNRALDGVYPFVYLDATFPNVREGGHVVSMALMIAVGVRADGVREVLGFATGASESADCWGEFLASLVDRGLHGVRMVISDAHAGLKAAVRKTFTGASWQRCKVHFTRNVVAQVPKSSKSMAAAIVGTIFAADDHDSARAQLVKVFESLENSFPNAASIVIEAEVDVLAHYRFPVKSKAQLSNTNALERLNREIGRRFDVVSIFPNREAVERLAGFILMDYDDEWRSSGKRNISLETMRQVVDPFPELHGQFEQC